MADRTPGRDRTDRADRGGHPPRRRSSTRPAERTRRAEPTRAAAYHLLRAVEEGAYANLELPKLLRRSHLAGRDAAFTTELAFGTLRHRAFYDAVIAVAADRPITAIDGRVLDVLRLGAHQLLAMRVPDHAAVDQTVGLARAVVSQGAGGFVNAVLRRIIEGDRESWLVRVRPPGGVAALALEYSHPEWVVTALRGALVGHGTATAEAVDDQLEALLRADNDPPRVALVARPGLTTVDDLIAQGGRHGRWAPTAVLLDSGQPGDLPEVRDGRAAVQDEGSQLVALALAAVPSEATGVTAGRWLDLCAGPGGKAGLLAVLASAAGADLVANEVSEHRADLVRATLAPAIAAAVERGSTIEVRTGDGRDYGAEEPGTYDRVLVDAPCTGLGALRRRPEARWRRQPGDLTALGPLQRDLLRSALDATAPGGVVGYATCSPHLAETSFVVRDVVKRRDDVEILDARPFFTQASNGALIDLGNGPFVQLWPHVHGTDGMFFALLRRR